MTVGQLDVWTHKLADCDVGAVNLPCPGPGVTRRHPARPRRHPASALHRPGSCITGAVKRPHSVPGRTLHQPINDVRKSNPVSPIVC